MSFQPVVLGTGFAGWAFLKKTAPQQKARLEQTPSHQRDITYSRDNIHKIGSSKDLVADRRLLRVALGAYDLGVDINNKYFIEKILSEGTTNRTALANKLSDKRYVALSKAFGFDQLTGPNTQRPGFANQILQRYRDKSFEVAVGQSHPDLRIALNLPQGIADALGASQSETAHWFRVLGTPPLRQAFEKALGLPQSIGKLDLDLQLSQFQQRAFSVFGSDKVADIAKPENLEKLTQQFLLRSQAEGYSSRNTQLQNASMLLSQIRFPQVSLF